MATPTPSIDEAPEPNTFAGLHYLAALPAWLVAATDSARVVAALNQHVAEFAAGELTIRECELDRLRLKGDHWEALYELAVGNAGGERELMLAGRLTPPDLPLPTARPSGGAFGTPEWRCAIPELRLELWMYFEDAALEALPLLTDAELSRAFLEASIRACSPQYADLHIATCKPKVKRYKPGSRCTVLYSLGYGDAPGAERWPDLVVAKTYSRDKGQNAYEAMSKMWASPLSKGDVVAIAEPLAYVPEQKILVQGPVRGDRSYKDLLRSALRDGSAAALGELDAITRKIAAGLVALHHCGARHGETVTWEDELAEIRGEVDKLGVADPRIRSAAEPLLARLEALATAHPAEPTLPAHRSFRPQQVQIDGGAIGFIDFDGYCLAEPALDIALFRATVKEMGINTSPSDKQKEFEYASEAERAARLAQLDTICETFLAEYQRLAPISRQRVALWEALDLLTVVLRCWSKVKPHQIGNAMLMLESQLNASGLFIE